MASLGPYTEYDHYLRLLMDAMRYKLRANAHKGDIGNKSLDELVAKMHEEIEELRDAAARGSEIEMILESSDICNFALAYVIAAVRGMANKSPTGTSHGIGAGIPGTDIRGALEHVAAAEDGERSGA